MPILTRTWPYGTKKRLKVLGCVSTEHDILITCVEPATGEGFMLVEPCIPGEILPSDGDEIGVEFTKGGVTGGFWKRLEYRYEPVIFF